MRDVPRLLPRWPGQTARPNGWSEGFNLRADRTQRVRSRMTLYRDRKREKMKVLLVDDLPLFREVIALLLERFDPSVSTVQAGTCEEALSLVAQHADCELILLDLGLPDRSGFEAIAVIRER